jgi:hypothetical protein
MGRAEIITALAAAFGPHLGWDGRHEVIDGDDEQGSCTTSFLGADGQRAYRSLTYGEVADALVAADHAVDIADEANVLHSEHHPGTFVPTLDSCPEHDRADYEARVREMAARPR